MDAAMIINFKVEKNAPLITRTAVTLLMKGDNEGNIIQVEMMDAGSPLALDGYSAVLYLQRKDGKIIRNPAIISGNLVTAPILEESLSVPGNYTAIIRIVGTGSTKRTILRIAGTVESDGEGPVLDPSGSIPTYEDIERVIKEMENEITKAEQTIKTAQDAAGEAVAAAGKANASTVKANAAATNAEAKANLADEATERANNAAKAAEDIVAAKLPFFDGTPSAPGTAAAGVLTQAARGDHVHPLPDLLPMINGGTGVRDVPALNQLTKSFHIVGSTSDANNALTFGLYGTTSVTENLPSGVSNGVLLCMASGYTFDNTTGTIDQFFIPLGGGRIWRRSSYNNNAWSKWTVAALDAYPVGAVFISYVSTSPASLFGGTWTQIKDRFLVGAGNSYTAGETGGANSVTLTGSCLPNTQITPVRSTDRFVTMCSASDDPDGYITPSASGTLPLYWGTNWGTRPIGEGNPHENRPPYFAVYIWRRTA